VVAHRLPVDVEACIAILHKVALLNEMLEILTATRVNLFVIRVCFFRESDLWLVDIQEAHGVSVGHGACLLRVKCVVGWADDLRAVLLVSKVALEGSDFDHSEVSVISVVEIRF